MVIAAAGAAAAGVVALAGKPGVGDKKKEDTGSDSNPPQSDTAPAASST